ncbi:MAG: ferritin family protein [Thermoleophilia bacterium]
MKLYRCLICGDPYMGAEKPSNCPFCGSAEKYLVAGADWVDENDALGEISDISQANLEKALQLEVNNSPFYRNAMALTDSVELQGTFKYLAKIEGEHASTLKKILKVEPPEPEADKSAAADDDHANLETAHQREVEAAAFYRQAASEAVEPRVKKVFTVLAEVETDHINMEEVLLGGSHL